MRNLAIALILLTAGIARGEWTPPENPDPSKILQEANSDTRAKRYEDALAKHVWYHENALRISPSQTGVRLSFALSYWEQLGKAYPPALEKLKFYRDQAAADTKKEEGKKAFTAAHEFAAINRTLDDTAGTRELFVWLDGNKPEVAKSVYSVMEPALIAEKDYKLCGKYVKPNQYESIVSLYRHKKEMVKDPRFANGGLGEHAEKTFTNGVATLIAILVINGHKDEAVAVATNALKELDTEAFKSQIEAAKKGEVPPPWP